MTWEFTIMPQNIVFGKGTLKEGTALVNQLEDEAHHSSNDYFDFPAPYDRIKISEIEGSEITAYDGETLLYDVPADMRAEDEYEVVEDDWVLL
jgi:hypothetical protein|tara:strand:+ start:558 stop:836 length:279 start_codon:yes stop_codon:yes gene_type:complete